MSPHTLKPDDIQAIVDVVGKAQTVQYNKPHVYPMATPMFDRAPEVERKRPGPDPVEVYVHIPFCSYKCSFCTYATLQKFQREQMERYVEALKKEMRWIEPGTPLKELYLGGGTPTALPADLLNEVLKAVFQRVVVPEGLVNIVECSPESISPDHIQVLKDHRIGRLSMGIQSLDDEVLQRLNRKHSSQAALAACDLILSNGLMQNVDLIYGLPGQSEQSFVNDFETVAKLGVHSVTVYNLRINERTSVANKLTQEEELDLEQLIHWRSLIRDCAASVGFKQARWHTYVRDEPEKTDDHPAGRFENFPAIGDQIGIGMSARSRLHSVVYRNHPQVAAYMERIEKDLSPVEEVFVLEEDDQKALYIGQFLGNGRPLDRQHYEGRFHCSFEDDFEAVLPPLHEGGLIIEKDDCIALSETGKLVFDLVNWMFYPKKRKDWISERQDFDFQARRERRKQN